KPDKAEAARFLSLLDAHATFFTFQTFDDVVLENNKKRKDPKLLRALRGSLDKCWDEIVRLNEQGAGVFVTVNETDGKRRTGENIVRVRALFADLDGAPLEPILQHAPEPTIVVESSPRRYHIYWIATGVRLEAFGDKQKMIAARFNGDDVHDLPRVMRLPGFVHRKTVPFLTRVICVNERATYPVPDFGPDDGAIDRKRRETDANPFQRLANKKLEADDLALLAAAMEAIPNDSDSWDDWNRIGMALFAATGGSDEGLELFHKWSQKWPGYNDKDTDDKWQTLHRSPPNRIGAGTIIRMADKTAPGWRDK